MKTLEQMAEEAGIAYLHGGKLYPSIREGCDTRKELQRFASLVAEECVRVGEDRTRGSDDDTDYWLAEAFAAIRQQFPKP